MSDEDRAVRFIIRFTADRGFPPSVRELGAELGHKSPATTHALLHKLVTSGRVSRVPGSPRTLVVQEATK